MKSKEELNALKEKVEVLNKKLAELSEDELKQVVGGDVTSANIVGYCANQVSGGADGMNEHLNFIDRLREYPDGRNIYVLGTDPEKYERDP